MSVNDWIKPRIAEAKLHLPFVTEPVLTRIEELLNSQLIERELSKGELTSIAKELVEGMTSVPPKAEAER